MQSPKTTFIPVSPPMGLSAGASPSPIMGPSPVPREQVGHIELILGPMFAGKSTELLRRVRRYSNANQKCLVLKYSKDCRYGSAEQFSTHDKQQMEAAPCDRLMDLQEQACQYDVLGIDEGQFFPDVVTFCEQMANLGKVIVISALDGTFERKPFGNVLELVPMAEHVCKLTAVCKSCYRDAAFTKRLGLSTEVEVIGGSEMYVPVCRECYDKPFKISPGKRGA